MLVLFFVFLVLLLYFVIKILHNADTRKPSANGKEREKQAPSPLVIQSENLSSVGRAGESAVSSVLHSLPSEYFVLDNIIIPDQVTDPNRRYTTQIDHVVVSPYGIFVIETKNFSGWIFGEEKSQQWAQTFKEKEGQLFYNPIKQNWGHIFALSEHLRINVKLFKPVIVFSNHCKLDVETTIPVVYVAELKSLILNYTQKIIPERNVSAIFNRLSSLCLNEEEMENRHVQSIRERLTEKEIALQQGRCPRCGGRLKLRKGRYGAFYGCSNYPKCRFTSDVKE